MDLHYLSVDEAKNQLVMHLPAAAAAVRERNAADRGSRIVLVVTGIGKRSVERKPKLKPEVEDLFKEWKVTFEEPKSNPGALAVDAKTVLTRYWLPKVLLRHEKRQPFLNEKAATRRLR